MQVPEHCLVRLRAAGLLVSDPYPANHSLCPDGSALPLLAVVIAPGAYLIPMVAGASLVFLATLGGLAAFVGGASAIRGAIRVTFWGALAMGITAGVGALFGTVV